MLETTMSQTFDDVKNHSSKNVLPFSGLQSRDLTADFDPEYTVNSKIATYLMNASILVKHKEFNLALNLLRQAANEDSKNPVVLSALASCFEKLNKFSESLIVRKNITKYDYSFESVYLYANMLYKSGDDQKAMEVYFEALALLTDENEHLFDLYKNMGNIYVRQGDFDGAEEFYNKANVINPQSDTLLVNLGTLEVQRNDFGKSLYCFRKAIELNSENDKAWVGLSMVHNHFGDLDLAWANLETAIDVNPRNRTAVLLLANWAVRDQKIKPAILRLQEYLSLVDFDEDMSLVLINLFCSLGDFANAGLEIERVLLWNPDQSEVLNLKKKLKNK